VVAYGDVEHLRPKSVYWWLAYCYDNHVFACQICNEGFKGDRFPIAGARMAPPRLSKRNSAIDVAAASCGPDPLDDSFGLSRAKFFQGGPKGKAWTPGSILREPGTLLPMGGGPGSEGSRVPCQ